MHKKIRLGLLFGGQSAEHEVSIQSARNIYAALDEEKYDIVLIGIDQKGKWHFNLPEMFLLNSTNTVIPDLIRDPSLHENTPVTDKALPLNSLIGISNNEGPKFDVIFPVLHGPNGEDGTIQGLLKLANIPFVGASVLGSAIGMDKDVTKRLLRDAGVPIAKFLVIRGNDQEISFDTVVRQLGLPLFIKPANLGSSVGVSKVKNDEEFKKALHTAFQFDTKVIIEEAIAGREIEMSVLGNENPITSIAGEVRPKSHDFYDYDAKYLDENGADIIIPADITQRQLADLQHLAIKTFQTLCCEGMARVDFFLTPDSKIYVNEINTIPGFTNISMYPKLWEASGIGYSELIDRLITLALERHERDASLQSTRH